MNTKILRPAALTFLLSTSLWSAASVKQVLENTTQALNTVKASSASYLEANKSLVEIKENRDYLARLVCSGRLAKLGAKIEANSRLSNEEKNALVEEKVSIQKALASNNIEELCKLGVTHLEAKKRLVINKVYNEFLACVRYNDGKIEKVRKDVLERELKEYSLVAAQLKKLSEANK